MFAMAKLGSQGTERRRMLSEVEKEKLLNELEQRFERRYKGILSGEDTQSVLREPREKWFRDEDGGGHKSMMTQAIGNSVVAWSMWEDIRRLTCRICGKSYVRQLTPEDHADEVAEKLCALIYAMATKRRRED